MSKTFDFENPPVVELVFGAKRSPLMNGSFGHLVETLAIDPQAESDSQQRWLQLIDDLLAARSLKDDWDGLGAIAPNPAVVDFAITLAQYFQAKGIAPSDFAVAGVNGMVQFEWHSPQGFLEIEVVAPDRAEGRLLRNGLETAEEFVMNRLS